jgi:arylsulfatase A-like enzyme
MSLQEPKNVILIIVDSVRYYRTGVDDRDRLDFMDEFKNDSVEFLNAFTSAPSSVMSAAAMFTGLHSAFVSRNYNDWEFDSSSITSLQSILKKNGYEIFSVDNSKVGREVKRDLILPINKSWFPKGISHGQFWTNLDVTKILKNILKKRDNNKKAFFMLWYDCRDDPNTSQAVQNAVEAFKEHGIFDNSLVFLTSDHGYPDPRTGLNKNSMRNMRHDMVVTDDNIKIPLFVKGPGIAPGECSSVVSTIDFTPTILDFLGLDFDQGANRILVGRSLKSFLVDKSSDDNLKQNSRLIRTDTRLLLQSGRVTAIRDSKNKLVIRDI